MLDSAFGDRRAVLFSRFPFVLMLLACLANPPTVGLSVRLAERLYPFMASFRSE